MNILVVTGSPRKNGNTEIMADVFSQAAIEAGHKVMMRKLSGLKIGPCINCEYCFSHDGVCSQQDDMNEVLKDVEQTDLLVIASPIYWFDVSAQTKCFIDRMYAFAKKGFRISSVAMLLNSGGDEVYTAAEAQIRDISAYLKWELKGIIKIPNLEEKGGIRDSKELEKVREFAKSI